MQKDELKETAVTHRIGNLRMNVYHTAGVLCHWHEEYEFILPDNHPCECIVSAEHFTLMPGQALLVNSRELHSVVFGEKYYAVTFHLSSVCGNEMLELFGQGIRFRRLYDIKNPMDAEIITALKKICGIWESPHYGFQLLLKSGIIYIIGKLFENGYYHSGPKDPHQRNAFAQILEFTNTNYSAFALTLDTVARHTHFSRSYISRLFRENTGTSFCGYLNDYRVMHAAELLASTEKSVLDISLACGFQSASYFIQVFKKRLGVTPLRYRTGSAIHPAPCNMQPD